MKLEIPGSGVSFDYEFATKEELTELIKGLENAGFGILAQSLKIKHADVLDPEREKSLQLTFSQKEVDLIYLVLGFVADSTADSVLGQIRPLVSSKNKAMWEERVKYTITSEPDLTITLEDF